MCKILRPPIKYTSLSIPNQYSVIIIYREKYNIYNTIFIRAC